MSAEANSTTGQTMTEETIHAAALSDRDNPPLTEGRLKAMRRSSRARVVRRALGMSQDEFSAKFHIPLEVLREWEALRSEPDEASAAYLKVIAADPDAVLRALHSATAA